ncbi:unnamed protein product [Aureobasidium pullulans]|nr:unnamed protein product [Aureobasidium pullulans]
MENSGTSASTLDKKWSSSGWNGKFYWYRTIGRSGKTWFQCGISANDRTPSSGKPSHFFTCKLMPRVGYTEQKIMKACEETAKALKFHRGPTGGRCDSCDFRNVQEVCTLGRHSMSRSQFRMMMDKHDKTSTSKLTLGQNIELSDDLSPEEWTFVPKESSPSKAYWTRTVKSGDETWNQYGLPICHSSPPTILHMYRKFHKRHVGSVPGAHWTRALKRNNKIYYQYGVGKQKRLTPDFWFTCKMEPRANASEADTTTETTGIAGAPATLRACVRVGEDAN